MNEIEDLKSQLAVLRNQLRDIEANDKIDLNKKMNLALRISKAIRKIYVLNQQDTALKIIEAIKNKSQTPIVHEPLSDPLDAQYPLKTQTAILRRLMGEGSKNVKGDLAILGQLFEDIMDRGHIDKAKRVGKAIGEINHIEGLNLKEAVIKMKVGKANHDLGFSEEELNLRLFIEDLDEEAFE